MTIALSVALLLAPHAGMATTQGDRCAVTAGQAGVAQTGDCLSSFYAWSPPTTPMGAGVASAPAVDTMFHSDESSSYVAQGETLFAIRNVADKKGEAGSIKWTRSAQPPTPFLGSPVPTLPIIGDEAVFVTGADGFLYKFRASNGQRLKSRDTRRRSARGALICPTDSLAAGPAVQMYNFSNDAFRQTVIDRRHRSDDLVFVMTANGCGDTHHNRVIAYWASNLSVAWTFNLTGNFDVHPAVEACVVDTTLNHLFCGTSLPQDEGAGQSSLFAIGSLTGDLMWATNAGPILHRPRLAAGRLYVVNRSGTLQAYDPRGNGFGGAMLFWSLQVAGPGATVSRNPALFRTDLDRLLVVDSSGVLRAVQDNNTSGSVSWDQAGSAATFVSAPVALASLGKGWIGRIDGRVQQIDLASGQLEGVMTVAANEPVHDPTLDVDPGTGADRLVVVAGGAGGIEANGQVTRLKLPLCTTPPPV